MNHKSTQNRLAQEKSPYLLQHADNPVDWYPWGDEAFEKAEKENKPVFLSIGYSTCHWCHVMEHESFEDPGIAQMINEFFIPVKVDREERPDIDNIYMTAVQSMTGQGGWPLTVFITPNKKPFYGGTYFPPQAKWGSPGLTDLLTSIHQSWMDDKQRVLDSSEAITEALVRRANTFQESEALTADVFDQAFEQYSRVFDSLRGGFGGAPKFPTVQNMSLLLRYYHRSQKDKALEMTTYTLDAMAAGGIYDHLGGGFHRYSTDADWQVPHFEKMLYDQAMIARAYLEAYQVTKNEGYADISREIFTYVLRDMRDEQGGFFSAEDADSLDPYEPDSTKKKEGAFFLWTETHLKELLSQEDYELFAYVFGVEKNGNVHSDPHGEFIGKNILYMAHAPREAAEKFSIDEGEVYKSISRSKEILLEERCKREHPHLDDKILTDWNGLMISALAMGGRVLGEKEYIEAASNAADFILHTMVDKNGRLLHRYRDGDASVPGSIEDYAFFINGLLDLYEASFDLKYLEKAVGLCEDMMSLFWDDNRGGFFFTARDSETLLYKQKEIYDGAIPSGNSLAVLCLLRMYHMTFDKKFETAAEKMFHEFAGGIRQHPTAYAQMLTAFDFAVGPAKEIVIVKGKEGLQERDISKAIYKEFLPNKVLLFKDGDNALTSSAPFTKEQLAIDGKTTVYLCENHVCKLPVTDIESLEKNLK